MSIRVSALVLMASLALAMGCPGGDGDGDGEAGTGNAGASGQGGSGGSGSGGGGSDGGGNNSGVTREGAMAGLCGQSMEGMGSCGEVGGLDEFTECANTTCMLDECAEGPCADTYDCYQTAADPCSCEQSAACQQCYEGHALCLTDCIGLITCDGQPIFSEGETTDGGACDQLDACCMSLPADNQQACMLTAAGVRSVGDMACDGVRMSLCP